MFDQYNTVASVCIPVASAVPGVKGFDEDSFASLNTTQDDMQDSHVTNGISNPPHPFQGGYMLAASYWPKVSSPGQHPFLVSLCQCILVVAVTVRAVLFHSLKHLEYVFFSTPP